MAKDSEVWALRQSKSESNPRGTALKQKTEAAKRVGKATYKPK